MTPGETLHQDARHRVTLFRAGAGCDRAVICFEPGRDRMNGFAPTACPRFAQTLGIDALTVQTAQRDWFISDRSPDLAQALDRATAHYADVTATGFSMGGYGALLYSAAGRVRRIMAVSPQYSIDPDIAPYDPGRHPKFARIGQPMPRPEDWGSPALRGVVLFDPGIPEDRQHAARIGAGFPGLALVALPYGGHPASGALGDAGRVGEISRMLVEDRLDPAAIRRMHRRARRGSARYQLNMASAAIGKHRPRAVEILRNLALAANPDQRLEAGLALLPLDPESGAAALARLLDDVPDAPPAWARRIGRALDALG